MESASPKILVDTSTLEAVCKTRFDEPVFTHLPLYTTDICWEEVSRNRSATSKYQRQRALKRVGELRRKCDSPALLLTDIDYKPYVADQGEQSIVSVLESGAVEGIEYVLLFDFDATDSIKQAVDGRGIEVNTPGRAFELVWQGGFITEADHHRALRQMAQREGWRGRALVAQLPKTSYEDVFD